MSDLPVVLFAFANHLDPEFRLDNLSYERNEIRKYLRVAEKEGLCEILLLFDSTFENLFEIFQDIDYKDRIAIFHFAGHASSNGLSMEKLDGESDFIFTEGYAKFLGQQKSLKLVFLNGCNTNQHAEYLHNNEIPLVISTKREVDDALSANIAIRFYQSLAADKTVGRAFREACSIVDSKNKGGSLIARGLGFDRRSQENPDWKLSTFISEAEPSQWCFSKAKNDPLFSLPKVEFSKMAPSKVKPSILPFDPFVGFRPYTGDDFNILWGRDYEIKGFYELLQEELQPSIAICHGVKGVGKTSFLSAGIIPRLKSGKYFVRSIYLDENASYDAFRNELTECFIEKEFTKGKGFVFVFGLSILHKLYVEQIIKQIQKTTLQITFILELTDAILSQWQSLFNSFRPTFYQLLPFNQKSIDSIFLKLSEEYNVLLDSKFRETFTSLILSDAKSGSTPLLQYTLASLLRKAKKSDLNIPKLDMNLLTDWNALIGFTSFIQVQLSKIDKEFSHSGIALEILNDGTRNNQLDSLPKLSELSKKYNLESSLLERLIDQLKANYLLSEPVSTVGDESYQIRLYHNILAHPLKDVIDNSYKPAQEIRRLLKYNLQENKLFDENEINLIVKNEKSSKVIGADGKALLNNSINFINDKNKRKRYRSYFKYGLAFSIIFLGVFLDNPYLLMYLILLFVFYIFENSPQHLPSKNE